ncbi:hypothetical protein A3218_11010 [Pseudomonas chlororaphis]|nr:hypothetical protein A3218_11010 [Pseudomonas chlororaphis]
MPRQVWASVKQGQNLRGIAANQKDFFDFILCQQRVTQMLVQLVARTIGADPAHERLAIRKQFMSRKFIERKRADIDEPGTVFA